MQNNTLSFSQEPTTYSMESIFLAHQVLLSFNAAEQKLKMGEIIPCGYRWVLKIANK